MALARAFHRIDGRHHPLVKSIRAIARSGELLADGQVLLETPHLIDEALASLELSLVVISADVPKSSRDLLRKLSPAVPLYEVPAKLFEHLTTTETHRGILALAKAPSWSEDALFRVRDALLIVLSGIQDAGNLGTILRAAEAFGVSGVLLSDGTVSPFNAKCVRAAAGALFRLPVIKMATTQIIQLLARRSVPLFATVAKGGLALPQATLSGSAAIAFGSEGAGLSPTWLSTSTSVSIPIAQHVESLNVAAAASIILYEAARQRAQMASKTSSKTGGNSHPKKSERA